MIWRFVLVGLLAFASQAAAQSAINFATSPAHPADSFHVIEFAWGCPSPAAAAEMLDRAEGTANVDVMLRAEGSAPATKADRHEVRRAAELNCLPLVPTAAFALLRDKTGAPVFRSWMDAAGFQDVAVAGEIIAGDGGRWKFYVAAAIVANAQSSERLAAPKIAPAWQPNNSYAPPARHYAMPATVMP